ncbi:cell wall-binding repeat-containing protein [Bacillus sp. V5-8f]|uniref:cell wall-binding repeat-containing protein n=1 Tax=Bacillus sp. V5-8f TaxID=2053044 RepID=UPI0015E14AFB|nr:cell wall-binding repeat-containing protein [Bacillus sp. V5-8f]
MKAISKTFSSMAAVSLVLSYMLAPSAHAETNDATNHPHGIENQEAVMELIKNRSVETKMVQQASVDVTPISSEVNYKQQLANNTVHQYVFTTNGGEFKVTPRHPAADDLEYDIVDFNSTEPIDESASNTYQLAAGSYVFVVASFGEQSLDYDYVLNGPFSQVPDTSLPELQVSQPADDWIRLEKGSSSTFTVAGTSKAQYLRLYVNDETREEAHELNANGSFSYDADLATGDNLVLLDASIPGGNTITSFYQITLPGVTRIQGKDRYDVSANMSSTLNYWGQNNGTVVIARGDMFPDALAGGPLASMEGAPILLTRTAALPDSVKNTIANLGAERAIILGGTGSVSANVEDELAELGVTEIERIGGADRFVVAAGVAEAVSEYSEADTAIIASGLVFPDALSASGIAGLEGMPILPVRSDRIPDPIQTFIKNHPEIEAFIVVGGPSTVKESVISQIRQLRNGAYVERISGQDRYEVALNVAEFGMEYFDMNISTLTFARGDVFADALSGAPLANYYEAPILLTRTNKLEEKVQAFLEAYEGETDHMLIFGGEGSVSKSTEKQLYDLIP